MAYTAEQLQSLIDLRASGKLRVTHSDGRSLQFQDGASLDRAIEQAKRDVSASAGGGRPTRRYPEYHRG